MWGNAANEDGDIKAVFQEAELSDAVLFFDECEVIFAKRDVGGNKILNLLLCELERYNGIVFLATNKPLDLDEAMHRRITSVYEFKAPDHCQRRMIWQSYASSSVPLHPDIPWDSIALKYELTGGVSCCHVLPSPSFSQAMQVSSRTPSCPLCSEPYRDQARIQLFWRKTLFTAAACRCVAACVCAPTPTPSSRATASTNSF